MHDKNNQITIFSDGASRGNPGPASIGVSLINNSNIEVGQISQRIGIATNNIAEYSALEAGLVLAQQLGFQQINIKADSELMIKQLKGLYKVKNIELAKIYQKIKALEKNFESISYTHIPREQNKRADALANLALDRHV